MPKVLSFGLSLFAKSCGFVGKFTNSFPKGYANRVYSRPVILGIESSCDDTGAAIVDGEGRVLGECLRSQQAYSSRFGGVIPRISRTIHEDNIAPVVNEALSLSGISIENLDAIAVTTEPGLVLCLRVGVNYARDLCIKYNKPFMPIHHMQAHAVTARLPMKEIANPPTYPYLCLLMSGGHCILTWIRSVDDFVILGQCEDGSPGEAFDKVSRRLKLRNLKREYDTLSGGVLIETVGKDGDPLAVSFPLPSYSMLSEYGDCDFTFSGLKGYALYDIERSEKNAGITINQFLPNIADVCASFQHAVTKQIARRLERAFIFLNQNSWLPPGQQGYLVLSGGVASNQYIRNGLEYMSAHFDYNLVCPPPRLCTDNGVMIAWNAVERFKAGIGIIPPSDLPSDMLLNARSPVGPVVPREKIHEARLAYGIRRVKKLTFNFGHREIVEEAKMYSQRRQKCREEACSGGAAAAAT